MIIKLNFYNYKAEKNKPFLQYSLIILDIQ